ncbi:hypothetical protein ACHAQA_009556 [Verticillium albo-atrum]
MSARPFSSPGNDHDSTSSVWEPEDVLDLTSSGETRDVSWTESQIQMSLRHSSSHQSSDPSDTVYEDAVEHLTGNVTEHPIEDTIQDTIQDTIEEVPASTTKPKWTLCRPWDRHLLSQIATEARLHHANGEPLPLHLVPVIRFNIWHALAENANLLGMDSGWLYYDSISPFNKAGPGLGPPAFPTTRCPASLQLTPLQPSVEHHPWIDLLPFPMLRQNFLREVALHGEDSVDEDDMCRDIVQGAVGADVVVTDAATLIVWGESWDPMGWEATVPFLRKWGWLFAGSTDILESTNYWRTRRGERALRF